MRSNAATLKYVVPDALKGEELQVACIGINAVPNKKTGPGLTPYQLVTGRKVTPQPHKFGEIGLTNSRRQDDRNLRAEYGIYMHSKYNVSGHMVVYMPHRKMMYSKRTFVSTDKYPAEWLLKR